MASQEQEQQQSQPSKRFSQAQLIILIFAILLTVVSVITALLTQGSWAATVSLILTAIGVILALYQLLVPLATSSSKTEADTSAFNTATPLLETPETLVDTDQEHYEIFRNQIKSKLAAGTGALIIYAKKEAIGLEILINVQITDSPSPYVKHGLFKNGFIAQYQVNGHTIYAAVFKDITPYRYHIWFYLVLIFFPQYVLKTVINVDPRQIVELQLIRGQLEGIS